MSELKNCPFCGGEACMHEHVFVGYSSTFGVVCLDCCAETRQFYNTEEEAAEKWNRRAQPENEALTLSELRGMGGEPVWIQESAPYTFAGYKILCSPVVDEYEDVCFEGGDCYYSHDYGKTWLAYRRKPERSEG